MLTAYFDDSVSEEADRLFVLAGYVHSAEAWAKFSDDWQSVLDAPPSIGYFKMKQAQNLSGEFLGWEPIARNAKVHALAYVIEKHKPWSLECSISLTDFLNIVRPISPYDLRSPYLYAFYTVIIKLAQWHHHLNLNIPTDFIFDEQGSMGTEAVLWFNVIKSLQPPEIQKLLGSTPVFRDDRQILPLQAADLLAWHIRRGKEARNRNEYRPAREKLVPLLHASVPIGEEWLHKIASDMSQVPHVGLTTGKSDSVKDIVVELLRREREDHEKNEAE